VAVLGVGQTGPVRTPARQLLAFVAAATLALGVACSDDGENVDAQDGEESSQESEPAPVKTTCEETSSEADAVVQRGKPSVVVPDPVPSELQVEDLVEGTGAEVIPDGTVEVHYVMMSTEGVEVDSSWPLGSPYSVPLQQIGGEFAEAMEGMKEGGRRQLVISAEELFGGRYPDGVEAEDMIVMVVDLVSVSEEEAPSEAEPEADAKALDAAEERGEPEMTVPEDLPSELTVTDDVEGTGDIVCAGDTVLAHYVGVDASSGEVFDNSWERGEPATFALDQVIDGWSEGLVGMRVGGRRTLVIPAALAYGVDDTDTAGTPTGDLVFTVDMVGVG
jgi:peptidylprolyl isomerase